MSRTQPWNFDTYNPWTWNLEVSKGAGREVGRHTTKFFHKRILRYATSANTAVRGYKWESYPVVTTWNVTHAMGTIPLSRHSPGHLSFTESLQMLNWPWKHNLMLSSGTSMSMPNDPIMSTCPPGSPGGCCRYRRDIHRIQLRCPHAVHIILTSY
jgi:hypothetical protein